MRFFFPLFALLLSGYAIAEDSPSATVTEVVVDPEAKKIISQIDENISRGHAEFKSCGRFKKKFKKIVPGGLNNDSPSHLNKKQALDYLSVLEKYPEPPRGYGKALDLALDNFELLLKEPDQIALMGKLAKIQDECAMFSVRVHLILLFKDVKAFEFSKKEKAKVVKLAKTYLNEGLPMNNFIEIGVRANVLKAYLQFLYEGAGKAELTARAEEFTKAFDATLDAGRARDQQLTAEGKAFTLESRRYVWTHAREFSARFSALVKELTF